MGLKIACQLGGLLLLIVGLSKSQEDSLRSALNAVDRRQKDLSTFADYGDFGYSLNGPDDLEFLPNYQYPSEGDKNTAIGRLILDYLDSQDHKKHISSSFRERLELDKERQLEDLAESLLTPENDRDEYQDEMQEYNYPKYKTPVYTPKYIQKRPYYYPASRYEYSNVQKRKYYDSADYSNDSDDPINRIHSRNYRAVKRFPVTKRSSDLSKQPTDKDVPKTDPKVAKELSNIFGSATTSTTTKAAEKPIQIKKKSVQWSDYFGLDRRKKSEDLDKEWLLERYQKAVAVADKRSVADYPLKNFKDHDAPTKKEGRAENHRFGEVDAKLKTMEDSIIDDALKYTGSREGTTDSQEIQEIKDRVISRLAAAYSLEKMRRALVEYKQSVAKLKQAKQLGAYEMNEKKRVVVPRKQAIDEDRERIPESDNNIKCSQGDENCEEQNYRTPAEVLMEQTTFDACPQVQRACNEASAILGRYATVFEAACNMQQMCLLCGNNSWFAPTRQCNSLFLTKAYELCDGKEECQKEAQRSVRYLLDVNRSLRLEPLGECELICPDKR